MDFKIFYTIAALLLFLSFIRERQKSYRAVKKTINALLKLLPQMSFILLLIGLGLTILSPESITGLLGSSSGFLGVVIALIAGGVTLLPSFIAFPLGATLLQQGAGLMQVGAFISALMGIGIVTFPMEKKFFGTHFAIYRNTGSLVMTIIFALVISLILGGNL